MGGGGGGGGGGSISKFSYSCKAGDILNFLENLSLDILINNILIIKRGCTRRN